VSIIYDNYHHTGTVTTAYNLEMLEFCAVQVLQELLGSVQYGSCELVKQGSNWVTVVK